MNKQKLRKGFIYLLLAFLVILYVITFGAFIFWSVSNVLCIYLHIQRFSAL